MKKTSFIAALFATCMISTSVLAADTGGQSPWINPFIGFSTAPHSTQGDIGAVYSIDNNLNQNGWLVRGEFFIGGYDYNHVSSSRVKQDVSYQGGSAMAGYHWHFQNQSLLSLYGGLEVQNNDNSDATAFVRGSSVGPKLQAEFETPFLNNKFYSYSMASYTTAWDSYSMMTKVGYRIEPMVSVGPELAVLGDDRVGNARMGGFVGFNVTKDLKMIGAAGYNFGTDTHVIGGTSGLYGTIHICTTF